MLNQGINGKGGQAASANNGAANANTLAGQNPYPGMAGMPGGFPMMMPPMAPGMPGMLPTGTSNDTNQNAGMQ